MTPIEMARIVAERYMANLDGQGEAVTATTLFHSMPWLEQQELSDLLLQANAQGLVELRDWRIEPTTRTLALMVQYERLAQRKLVYDADAAYPTRP